MRINAVTVCVDYSDFLAHSLPYNKSLFDRLIVVTSKTDRATADLCEHHHVECIKTDVFYKDGATFNKGAGINEGLKALGGADWVCHFDADIVLPPRTRDILNRIHLDPTNIYGVDRLMCRSFDDWANYMSKPEVQHSCESYIQANAFPLGVRVGKLKESGWLPIGFFQLWHPALSGHTEYTEHGTADRGDMRFALQWPRQHRVLIPEIVGIHLASEIPGDGMGSNWNGRRTPHFGPSVKQTVKQCASAHNKISGDFYRDDGSFWRRVGIEDGEPIEFILRGPLKLEKFRAAPLFTSKEEREHAEAWHISEIAKIAREATPNFESPKRPALIASRPNPWRQPRKYVNWLWGA